VYDFISDFPQRRGKHRFVTTPSLKNALSVPPENALRYWERNTPSVSHKVGEYYASFSTTEWKCLFELEEFTRFALSSSKMRQSPPYRRP
jgi:predicted double-glycine peptidase